MAKQNTIEYPDNYRETAVLIAVSTPDVAEEKNDGIP